MKLIPLTQGQFAKVDDEDYEYLSQFKWQVHNAKHCFYAQKTCRKGVKKTVKMHRDILGITDKKIHVDHINHDGLDNQRSNLRTCTPAQNCANRSSIKNSSSKFLGVTLKVDRRFALIKYFWTAQIRKDKKTHFLKMFPYTPEGEIMAAKTYDEAAKKYHGEFANLNFKD